MGNVLNGEITKSRIGWLNPIHLTDVWGQFFVETWSLRQEINPGKSAKITAKDKLRETRCFLRETECEP